MNTRNAPRLGLAPRARALSLSALVLLAGTVHAGELRVQGIAEPTSAGQFRFQVANDGTQRLEGLRFHLPAGYQVSCSGEAGAGAGNGLDGGERRSCVATVPGGRRSGAFAVSAHTGDGRGQVGTVTTSFRGAATPDQGFVALVAGAVHDDVSGDGLLDAGETIDYHYTVLNLGNLDLSDVQVQDLAGVVSCPQTTLAVDASMICTRSYLITGADAAAGEVVNEIEVTGQDSLDRDVQGADLVVRINLQARAGISVFKSPILLNDVDGNGFPSVGDELLYHFISKNNNAEALAAVDLVELDPSLIDGPIDCSATTLSGVPFSGLGTGALASMDSIVCEASYTITPADGTAGQVVNLVEAQAQALIAGSVAGTGASLLLLPLVEPALLIEKTVSPTQALPGEVVTFTITMRNVGNLPLSNVQMVDPLPAGVAGFEWTCAGTIACPNAAGTGAINETVPTLPIAAELVYTVQATLGDDAPDPVINIVTATPDGNVTCVPGGGQAPCQADAQVEVLPPGQPRLEVSKSVAPSQSQPGQEVEYTLVIRNAGDVDLTNVLIVDPLPAGIAAFDWICIGVHCPNAAGSGAIAETVPVLPVAAELVYSVQATLDDDATDPIINIVSATPDGVVTCVPGGGQAPCQADAQVEVLPAGQPRLEVSKSVAPQQSQPGQTVVYTIVVRNAGDIDLADVQIVDPLPAGVASFAWTCAGAACPNASGDGAIDELVPLFPVAAEVVYTVQAILTSNPPTQVINIVAVSPDGIATCVPSGEAPPCQADAVVGVILPPRPVPVDRPWALLLLAGLTLLAGSAAARRRNPARAVSTGRT